MPPKTLMQTPEGGQQEPLRRPRARAVEWSDEDKHKAWMQAVQEMLSGQAKGAGPDARMAGVQKIDDNDDTRVNAYLTGKDGTARQTEFYLVRRTYASLAKDETPFALTSSLTPCSACPAVDSPDGAELALQAGPREAGRLLTEALARASADDALGASLGQKLASAMDAQGTGGPRQPLMEWAVGQAGALLNDAVKGRRLTAGARATALEDFSLLLASTTVLFIGVDWGGMRRLDDKDEADAALNARKAGTRLGCDYDSALFLDWKSSPEILREQLPILRQAMADGLDHLDEKAFRAELGRVVDACQDDEQTQADVRGGLKDLTAQDLRAGVQAALGRVDSIIQLLQLGENDRARLQLQDLRDAVRTTLITPDPDHVGDLPGALAVEQAVGRLTGLVMVPPKTVQTYRYRVDIDECTTELDAKDPHLARLTAVWRVKFSDGDGSLKLDPQAEGERLRALAAGCNDPKTTVVGPVSVDEKTGEYCVPISRTARVEKEADISALSLFINVPARPVEGGMAIHLAEMTGSPYPRSWYWNR